MTIVSPNVQRKRKVLVICTFGGASHAIVAKILAERGWTVELASLEYGKKFQESHTYISKVHIVSQGIPAKDEDAMFRRMDESTDGFKTAMGLLNTIWPETYHNIDDLVTHNRPDLIYTDNLDSTGFEVGVKHNIPVVQLHPQLPKALAPAKHMPGIQGLQQKQLSSEHASLWDRFYEELWAISFKFSMMSLIINSSKMRKQHGAIAVPPKPHPDGLILINSNFATELPKALPPLVVSCGPLLDDSYKPLGDLQPFLDAHKKVLYIAFGSRVNLPTWRVQRIYTGVQNAIDAGHIDGVIWGLRVHKSADTDASASSELSNTLANRNPQWKVIPWVPQRAILAHPSTVLFVTHCGGGSANEAAFHGTPTLAMPIFGDQYAYSKRFEKAGTGLKIDKDTFTSEEVFEKIRRITTDTDGSFKRNVLRVQRISSISAKRKYLAADMMEEFLADHELRFENIPNDETGVSESFSYGKAVRPMHLEPADARMGFIKRKNLDMWFVSLVSLWAFGYGAFGLSKLALGLVNRLSAY